MAQQMVQVGTHTQGQPAAHALSDFQEEFIDAKRELLAARQQIAAAAGSEAAGVGPPPARATAGIGSSPTC